LRRRYNLAIHDQRRGAVVVKCGYAEDFHRTTALEYCVDERRHGRALGQNQQAAQQDHHDNNG
jgi:hypothetical protein